MVKEFPNNSFICAKEISIGKNFKIGANCKIQVKNLFSVGDFSVFGSDVSIKAESITIGQHFFHLTPGLNIGGGGSQFPEATLIVGDKCVFHNNYLNLCCPIKIGNDVGLSPDVQIITHGFWQSVLEGYPAKYDGVEIGNGVIVGQRSTILPGSTISDNCVIGANSTVCGSLDSPRGIYVGSPAKLIKTIETPTKEKKEELSNDLINRFIYLVKHFNMNLKCFSYEYPLVKINNCVVDLINQSIDGVEDNDTDTFRDYLRRFGIRIYTERPFGNFQ